MLYCSTIIEILVTQEGVCLIADDTHTSAAAPEILPLAMQRSGRRVTYAGMIVNSLLIVLKLIAGVAGRSQALVADAVHSLSDFITDIGVLLGLRYLSKPADSDHPYGHGRFETVISLFMGLLIAGTGAGMAVSGVRGIIATVQGMPPAMPGAIALVIGFVSIAAKEGLYRYTMVVAKRTGSTTLRANAWHHRSDALSSVATVLGVGGAMLLGDTWTVLDPVAAIVVSALVVKVGLEIGIGAVRELCDEAVSTERRRKLDEAIQAVPGVQTHHQLRTRSLGRYMTVDTHIQVNPDITVRESHAIAHEAEDAIRRTIGNAAFVTIHVEPGAPAAGESPAAGITEKNDQ